MYISDLLARRDSSATTYNGAGFPISLGLSQLSCSFKEKKES